MADDSSAYQGYLNSSPSGQSTPGVQVPSTIAFPSNNGGLAFGGSAPESAQPSPGPVGTQAGSPGPSNTSLATAASPPLTTQNGTGIAGTPVAPAPSESPAPTAAFGSQVAGSQNTAFNDGGGVRGPGASAF